MTEMIERVARILFASPSSEETAPDWQVFVPVAREVLHALREPTGSMRTAGAEFFEEGDPRQNEFAAEIVYGAMIEAALTDEAAQS